MFKVKASRFHAHLKSLVSSKDSPKFEEKNVKNKLIKYFEDGNSTKVVLNFPKAHYSIEIKRN